MLLAIYQNQCFVILLIDYQILSDIFFKSVFNPILLLKSCSSKVFILLPLFQKFLSNIIISLNHNLSYILVIKKFNMLINILIHRQISNSKLIVFTIVHKDFIKHFWHITFNILSLLT